MNNIIEELVLKLKQTKIWNEEPVFCFTSDIDWASEDVMEEYFSGIDGLEIIPTLFVTHHSEVIEKKFKQGKIERGIHPNFLNGSSHGSSFEEVIETCIKFAPESECFRSHRLFDVTDITHLLKNKYHFKYVSNLGTILQPEIRPVIHESGLIHFPIFFEDGTHLWNNLDFNLEKYEFLFKSPGIKIISFHPMNFVFNSPSIKFMRNIKDSMSREEFNNISTLYINKFKNNSEKGIRNTIENICAFVEKNKYKTMTLSELYYEFIR